MAPKIKEEKKKSLALAQGKKFQSFELKGEEKAKIEEAR